jgi:hypothetical protein
MTLELSSRRVDWRLLRTGGLVLLVIANVYLLYLMVTSFPLSNTGADWTWNYAPAARYVLSHDLLALFQGTDTSGYVTRYSPVLAYLFAALLPIGVIGWTALHFAALAALPRRLALLAVLSFPFWVDVWAGNILVFVLVAAVAALDGRRWGVFAFMALAVAAPRPLMLPVLAYLLWQDGWSRRAFLIVFAVHAVLVLLTGLGPAWVHNLLGSEVDVGGRWDFGPARIIGAIWIPIGLALAAWFTYRGRLGFASLVASPYWLLQYPLILLLEWRPRSGVEPGRARH